MLGNRGTGLFPALPPDSPLLTGTLPSTLLGTFGYLGFLSFVVGGPDLKAGCLPSEPLEDVGLLDYPEIIKDPMDLKTLEELLVEGIAHGVET